jgi:antitoxin HigA-1
MKKLKNVHPGEILEIDFMKEMKISFYDLAKAIDVELIEISQLLNGASSISADTALRLGRFFNVSPGFWMNLQNHFDLEEEIKKGIRSTKKLNLLTNGF